MMSDTTTDPASELPPLSEDPPPVPDGRLVGKTVSALAVACHNLAVETEFTQGGAKALGWYKRSAELVKVVNDEDTNEMMRQKILESYLDTKRKYGQRNKNAQTHAGAPINAIRSIKKTSKKSKGTPSSSSSNFYMSKTTPQSYDVVRASILTRTLTADEDNAPVIPDDNYEYAEIEQNNTNATNAHSQPVNNHRPRSADHARVGSDVFQQTEIVRPKTANPNAGRFSPPPIAAPASPTKPIPISPTKPLSPAVEKSAVKLAHKIDMIDKLANEARKALTDLSVYTNVAATQDENTPQQPEQVKAPATNKTRTRPKSAVELGGKRVPHKVRTPQLSTANPQLSAELLSTSKARNSTNIRKLLEQREETMQLLLKKEKEVKSIRSYMKRLEMEGKEREDFDERLIQEYKEKVSNFEAEKQGERMTGTAGTGGAKRQQYTLPCLIY